MSKYSNYNSSQIDKKASYKSAIVIIPPQSCWQQLQNIRKHHDKAYERWMPHINLIYPYYEDTMKVFDAESQQLIKHLGNVKPFRISFTKDSVGKFQHGRSNTVWVKPLRPTVYCPQRNNTTSLSTITKKKKVILKTVRKKVARRIDNSSSGSNAGRDQILLGFDPPIVGSMKNYESSLDNLRSAFWTPDSREITISKKDVLAQGPGLDCLRFAEYTPENCKKEMFGSDIKMNFSGRNIYYERQRSQSEYVYEDEWVEVTDDEDEQEVDIMQKDDTDREFDERYSDPLACHPEVMKLQNKLQECYPSFNEISSRSADGFQPHLTLGQYSTGSLIDDIKRNWSDMEFDVKEVYLISRLNDRSPFKIKNTIPLGAFVTDL